MAIRDVVQEQFHQSIFVVPVLAMPNMERNLDIEALAGSRNVAMHWGDPSLIVDRLVELAIDRKIHITPTPASIAAQVQLVEPGLVLPRKAPAGLEAQELHIHVNHLHIHIPQGLSELQGTADYHLTAAPGGPGRGRRPGGSGISGKFVCAAVPV